MKCAFVMVLFKRVDIQGISFLLWPKLRTEKVSDFNMTMPTAKASHPRAPPSPHTRSACCPRHLDQMIQILLVFN